MAAAHGRSGRCGLEGDYNAIMTTDENCAMIKESVMMFLVVEKAAEACRCAEVFWERTKEEKRKMTRF
jgi:hypothetical protein